MPSVKLQVRVTAVETRQVFVLRTDGPDFRVPKLELRLSGSCQVVYFELPMASLPLAPLYTVVVYLELCRRREMDEDSKTRSQHRCENPLDVRAETSKKDPGCSGRLKIKVTQSSWSTANN
jgi:hypothetical protein